MKNLVSGLFSIGAAFALGWFAHQFLAPKDAQAAGQDEKDPAVRVDEVKSVAFNPETEFVGHVEPVEETAILPQIDGYIRRVCFTEGAKVAAGDLLFEIDDEQYLAARNLRYSEVRSAEAKVIVAQAEVDRAQRYYRRLSAADDRGITATDRDTAETTLASAKAALNSANAAVEQAKASAAIADFNLKHTKVYAPISGRIGKALHHVGDYVSPSKTALAKVVKLDPIRVVFPITDRDFDGWKAAAERAGKTRQDACRFRLRLANGEIYREQGRIEFGSNEMNRETGTLVMYASFANPANRLVPNAFVRVLVDAVKPPQVPAVPSGAVELGDDGTRVWTVDGSGTVHPQPVKVGASWKGMTVLEKGPTAGTRVVSSGAFKLRDGVRVRIVQ